jgi:gamma-glutamyl hydrolase
VAKPEYEEPIEISSTQPGSVRTYSTGSVGQRVRVLIRRATAFSAMSMADRLPSNLSTFARPRSVQGRRRRCHGPRDDTMSRNATTQATRRTSCPAVQAWSASIAAVLMTIVLVSAIPAIEGLVPPIDAAAASAGRNHHRLGSTNKNHPFQPLSNADMRHATSTSCHCQSPPVIGVFSQPVKARGGGTANATVPEAAPPVHYIAASYIKWLEAGGARAVAIPYDAPSDTLDEIFGQIHMVFLPGGDAVLSPSIAYMLNKVHESNLNGNAFPVWGTCLGMELLLVHFGQGGVPLAENYDAENMSLPLLNVVVPDAPQSNFKGTNRRNNQHEYDHIVDDSSEHRSLYDDPAVYRIATTQSVTLNNHKKGMSPERFLSNRNLTDLWRITSTNVDRQNQSFVSTIEPVDPDRYPYYGVQYHPEKNMFEYAFYEGTTVPYEVIAHSPDAIEFSYRIARYAVKLAQRSRLLRCSRSLISSGNGPNRQQLQQGRSNKGQLTAPDDLLLYRHEYTDPVRFPPMYTYLTRSGINFEQVYLIPPAAAAAAAAAAASAIVDGSATTAATSYSLTLDAAPSASVGIGGTEADRPDRALPDARSVMQW